ncbi:GNAT family N-acetyltransferase [Clostridium aestuarii]|uniref:GNAT family N-acetyltransferase n=1 Tax=Clostridium aestuarii TaxID=338193 RepID=A0ABT4D0I9_9CLOT|nr:GNAT family N-acetyltransferase [Clostridium aestuarii]MCY6484755.1 GNAT family N-acetyltransferase [Clostridium aestuarii]
MKEFSEIWTIYCESFPEDERRTARQQKEILSNDYYKLKSIYYDNVLAGFYGLWHLEHFIFIEHIAIDKKLRGKGYGSRTIKEIIRKSDKKIILEVEKPKNYEAKKRIEFYEKLGFHLNYYDYEQPAYDETKESVSLMIMSYPNKIATDEFKIIKNELYNRVYLYNKTY